VVGGGAAARVVYELVSAPLALETSRGRKVHLPAKYR
jgi:hypothetical protein